MGWQDDPIVEQKSYDTQLDPAQEKAYRVWMNRIGHTKAAGYRVDDNFTGHDYDYRGFFQKNGPVQIGQGQHFPDEFKKPAHETFSNESKYAVGADAAKAGRWEGDTFNPAASWQDDPIVGETQRQMENGMPVFPSLPGEEDPNARPMSEAHASFGKSAGRYFGRLSEADSRARQAMASDPFGIGKMEAGASLLTGGIFAPILGTAESIALGTNPDESFARYTYQPRSESGRAQLGALGALVSPLAESGADIALGPLAAAESRAVGSARVAPNAARPPTRGGPGGRPNTPVSGAAPARQVDAGLAQAAKSAPSIDELKSLKDAAYKRAEDAGITISEGSLKGLKTKLAKIRTNPTLHPDTTAAIKDIFDAKGEQTLSQLDELRQIANAAKGSLKADDQRLASQVVDTIDDYIDNLSERDVTGGKVKDAAALKEARGLYSRLKKSEEINELFRRAEIKAGANYTQSGLENALRGEFKALALNQRKLRRFNKEERAAIERVAKGAPLENALRYIGKMAPTGTVSGMLGAIVSSAVPGGVALPIAGLAGRAAATKMTLRNARSAEELMRRGPGNALTKPARRRNALVDNQEQR